MRLDPRAEEAEISSAADYLVGRVKTLAGQFYGAPDRFGIRIQRIGSELALQGGLDALAEEANARPCAENIKIMGRIRRMVDPGWWRRNLRRELLRENENQEHALGAVRRKGQCYVSDHAMKRKAARAKVNRATLEALEVVNELGQALNLQEVADKSISNPALRRAELMTRCRGFEETAKFMGHEGLFLTLTCPSRFHKFTGGVVNKKWTDATPKDGHKYLCAVWKKIRAAWNRAGFFPYGFRVAEPHHDGCPHWHILLFVDPEHAGWFQPLRLLAGRTDSGAGVVGIAGRYALQDSPTENGAVKHRFTCKRIDPSQGSATGYIAKYIAKNIDGLGANGEGVGLDYASGKTAETGAARVRTWAQSHSIRQFQQIGGPSVTVWRQLRTVKTEQQSDLFEAPRAAADRGLWSLFWVLQGGPDVQRKDLSLKPAYIADSTGKYGDDIERVWGVQHLGGGVLQTKMHTWTVQKAGIAACDFHEAVRIDQRAVEAGAEAWAVAHGFESVSDFQASSEACSPWTRVNNCTESDQIEADRLDRQRGAGLNFQRGEGKPTTESNLHEPRRQRIAGSHPASTGSPRRH